MYASMNVSMHVCMHVWLTAAAWYQEPLLIINEDHWWTNPGTLIEDHWSPRRQWGQFNGVVPPGLSDESGGDLRTGSFINFKLVTPKLTTNNMLNYFIRPAWFRVAYTFCTSSCLILNNMNAILPFFWSKLLMKWSFNAFYLELNYIF